MKTPYYKLATWVDRFACFRDGKRGYPTEAVARTDAKAAGTYRISTVSDTGRVDGEPFKVNGPAPVPDKPRKYTGGAERPMSGRPH
jgi:hypothetical protein